MKTLVKQLRGIVDEVHNEPLISFSDFELSETKILNISYGKFSTLF